MNKLNATALNLKLSGHTGKYIGFFHTGGNPIVRGWWEYKDGSEGGELIVDSESGNLIDYDGCYELPAYVVKEIELLGVNTEV